MDISVRNLAISAGYVTDGRKLTRDDRYEAILRY